MPETPRTVLYLDHTAKWSGGEIALLRTLEELDREAWTPLVVVAEDGPFVARLREIDIETLIFPLGGDVRDVRKDELSGAGALVKRGMGALQTFTRYAGQIANIARARDVSLIHCNSLKSDIYGALAGKRARRPVLWHVRDHIATPYLPARAASGFRALARLLPRVVVANSHSTAQTLLLGLSPRARARMTAKTHVVYDGLPARDLLNAAAPPAPTRDPSAPKRIGIVGRITEWKGQRVFLDAAARLLEANAVTLAPHFVIIGAPLFGETDFEAELKAIANKPPLVGNVTFTGFRDDIPAVLQTLDILVHASTSPEPFGQVVIEGMAANIPVIGANAGGVQEIIRPNETGLLTPPSDPVALAQALATLLANPARAAQLATAAHADVRARFTAAASARALEAVYACVVGR